MRVEKLTTHIGAELSGVSLADAAHDPALFQAIREQLLAHKVLFLRDQDISPRRPRGLRPPVRRAGGPSGGRQRSGKPRPGAHLQGPDQPARALRERLALRRHLARGSPVRQRAALRRDCPRSAATRSGSTWSRPMRTCRRHQGQIASLRPATASRPASARPCRSRSVWPARQVSGRGAPGGAHPSRDRREGAVRQFVHHPLRELPHSAERPLRPGLRAGRGEPAGLPDRAAIPEYQVRWRWTKNSVAIWDNRCTQHYAVHGLLARHRKMERAGIVGDRPY
jgi:taurine dioxygenase